MRKIFYPKWWLELVGFFDYMQKGPSTDDDLVEGAAAAPSNTSWGAVLLSNVLVGVVCCTAGVAYGRRKQKEWSEGNGVAGVSAVGYGTSSRRGYTTIERDVEMRSVGVPATKSISIQI